MRTLAHLQHFLVLLCAAGYSLAFIAPTNQGTGAFESKINNWDEPCIDKCAYDLPNSPEKPGRGHLILHSPDGDGLVDLTPAVGWDVESCKVTEDPKSNTEREGPPEKHKKTHTVMLKVSCPSGQCKWLDADPLQGLVARLPQECHSLGFGVVLYGTSTSFDTKTSFTPRKKGVTENYNKGWEQWSRRQGSIMTLFLTSDLSKTKKSLTFRFSGETTGAGKSSTMEKSSSGLESRASHETSVPLYYKKPLSLLKGVIDCVDDFGSGSGGKNKKHRRSADSPGGTDFRIIPDVDIKARIGFNISGSIFPPSIDEAVAYAIVDGHAGADLDVTLDLEGEFDTTEIPLIMIPISPFTVGFASVGPLFELAVRVNGDFSAKGHFRHGLRYEFNDYRLTLPSQGPLGDIQSVKRPIDGDIRMDGSLTVHIIPRFSLAFWVVAFVEASVFIDLDISAQGDFHARFINGKRDTEDETLLGYEERRIKALERGYDDEEGGSDEEGGPGGTEGGDGDKNDGQGDQKGDDEGEGIGEDDPQDQVRLDDPNQRDPNLVDLVDDTSINGTDADGVDTGLNSTNSPRFAFRYGINSAIALQVGAQVVGGFLTQSMLDLFGISDLRATATLFSLQVFNFTGTIGDSSILEHRAIDPPPAVPEMTSTLVARSEGSSKGRSRFKGILPISLDMFSGLLCFVDDLAPS